jgi:hypothetical protein
LSKIERKDGRWKQRMEGRMGLSSSLISRNTRKRWWKTSQGGGKSKQGIRASLTKKKIIIREKILICSKMKSIHAQIASLSLYFLVRECVIPPLNLKL